MCVCVGSLNHVQTFVTPKMHNTPQRCHILILELMKCYLTLEKGLSDVSKLSILKWGDYSGLSGVGPKYNHKCLYNREAEGDLTTEAAANTMMEARCSDVGFEDWGRGQILINAKNIALKKEKKQKCAFSSRASGALVALNFSPGEKISDFWCPEP